MDDNDDNGDDGEDIFTILMLMLMNIWEGVSGGFAGLALVVEKRKVSCQEKKNTKVRK